MSALSKLLAGRILPRLDEIERSLSGESNDDSGTITATLGEDDLPLLTVASPFGVDDDGEPYYDPDGAAPLEAAMLTLDPDDGLPVLTTLTGGF